MLLIMMGVNQYYTIAIELQSDIHRLSNKEIPLTYSVAGIIDIYYYLLEVRPQAKCCNSRKS